MRFLQFGDVLEFIRNWFLMLNSVAVLALLQVGLFPIAQNNLINYLRLMTEYLANGLNDGIVFVY